LGEDEHPTINGQVIPLIRSSGSRKRSITNAISNLRTLRKAVEHMVVGMETIGEHIEMLDEEKVVAIRGQQQA
jgi:hypothetical protein